MYSDIFHKKALDFLKSLFVVLKNKNIVLKSSWDIDHICYRCASDEEYTELTKYFLHFSDLVIESPVNGRLISTFKLHRPISFKDWLIELIEVPAPKKGKITKSGFEHIEIVCDENLLELSHKFDPTLVNTSGLSKSFNQELELILGEENIKFHNYSLESVIRLEKNEVVFDSLQKSQILTLIKKFNPLVAGTFPLGIYTSHSDMDICLSFDNENDFITSINSLFSDKNDFFLKPVHLKSGPAILVQFKIDEVSYELVAQQISTEKQTAFQHFQIEEKILKYISYSQGHHNDTTRFRDKLKQLRAKGLKTEPSFAKLLSLENDGYDELLSLNKISISALRDFLETHYNPEHERKTTPKLHKN